MQSIRSAMVLQMFHSVCVSVSHLVTTVSFTKRLNRLSMFMWEPCIGGRTPRGKDNFGGYVPAHCKM